MRKIIVTSLVLFIVFILSACSQKQVNQVQLVEPVVDSVKNVQKVTDATYIINDEPVTLKNGISEGVSSSVITRYFGNDAAGDLNDDGEVDLAFLLTQETGGSGTFYYVAVALAGDQGYQGLNAIYLGDRIAPQTTEISDKKIIVNYADRKIDESFAVKPSIGISKYFQIENNKLIENK